MLYKNGREAKSGDHVITRSYSGKIISGVVYDLVPGSDSCNCSVAVFVPGGAVHLTCQTLGSMYHVEDAYEAIEPKVSGCGQDYAPGEAPGKSCCQH